MGVSTNFYTIYGIKIDWNEEFDEAYNEVYDDPDTPYVLMDGMCGEYMIFGEVLFNSGDARWGFENGDQHEEFDVSDLFFKETAYRNSFEKKFPQFKDLIDKRFKVMSLTHYS